MPSTRVPREDRSAASMITVVPVEGMTCRTCERRIERHVGRIASVEAVSASATNARVEVTSSGPLPAAALAEAIEAAGYRIGRTPWLARESRTWLAAAGGLALVVAIAVAAELSGLTSLASGAGSIADGGLVVAGLLGLAAGVSTCMALTGGLVLALSAAFAASRPAATDTSVALRLRPTVVFLGGRVVGFAVLGAVLGAVGSAVVLPAVAVAALMIAVAVVMTILGVRLTGLSPRIAAWSPTLPARPRATARPRRGRRDALLGPAGRRPGRRDLLPSLRVHPGRPGLRALDRLAALRRRDHGRVRPGDGPRPPRPRRPARPPAVPDAARRPAAGRGRGDRLRRRQRHRGAPAGRDLADLRRHVGDGPGAGRDDRRWGPGAADLPGRDRLPSCRCRDLCREAHPLDRRLAGPELLRRLPPGAVPRPRGDAPRGREHDRPAGARARPGRPTRARWGCTAAS